MRFLVTKVLYSFCAMWVIVTLTFLLMKALPGDPFMDERALPKEIHEKIKEHYGLNDPLGVQYTRYLSAVVRWDFGPSFKYKNRTINSIIADGFPISATIGLQALAVAFFLGITGGVYAAINKSKAIPLLATLCISVPTFLMAAILQWLLGYKLGLLPVARWGTFYQTILPTLALAAMPTAMIFKLMKERTAATLGQDYIRTAKAKGLPLRRIITAHVVPNAAMPLLPYFGPLIANIIVGSFVTEKIFSIPGLGRWFVMSVMSRDYTAIMGLTVFYSVMLLGMVLVCDLLYYVLDPRQRDQVAYVPQV